MDSYRQVQMVEDTAEIGKNWEKLMIPGVVFIAVGIVALTLPFSARIRTNNLLCLLFLLGGLLKLFEAISYKKIFDSTRRFFLPVTSLVMSILLFRTQNITLPGIAVLLTLYFFTISALQALRFTELQEVTPWRWTLLSAGVSFALGIYTIFELPLLASFNPTTVMGIDMLAIGISMTGFSNSLKKFSTDYYSAKAVRQVDGGRKEEPRREQQPMRKKDESVSTSH